MCFYFHVGFSFLIYKMNERNSALFHEVGYEESITICENLVPSTVTHVHLGTAVITSLFLAAGETR